MKLEKIENKLKELNIKVYYGSAEKESEELKEYIVFGRDKIKPNTGKMSNTDYYDVVVVMENWIAEGFIDELVEKLEGIGLHQAQEPIDFNYLIRNDISYEIASIKFYVTTGRVKWR